MTTGTETTIAFEAVTTKEDEDDKGSGFDLTSFKIVKWNSLKFVTKHTDSQSVQNARGGNSKL